MRKLKFLFLIVPFLTLATSCSNNEEIQEIDYLSESSLSSDSCIEEDDFMEIAEGFTGFYSELMDETELSLQDKIDNLEAEATNYPDHMSLEDLSKMYSRGLGISKSYVDLFLNTLVEYKSIITAEGFSECFYNTLRDHVGEEAFQFQLSPGNEAISKRWFLSTLASALGASRCVSGVLAIVDTAAYVATGIITAPTGIGAVATWGGAAASAAYAFSTVGDNDC